MEYLEWNKETMGLGIKLIDDQHKELLNIINKLSTSINEHSQANDILVIVDELINYATYHFSTEEKIFDEFNYNETINHKKEHEVFVKKFLKIKDRIKTDKAYLNQNSIEIAEDIFSYIINWFLNHIVCSDRKYVELFKENGVI